MSRLAIAFTLTLLFAITTGSVSAQPPRGGGDRSGGRGSGGGAPGGRSFGGPSRGGDPSSFLSRLDRNGNGMIDTDEMQGPAKFMIDRMARDNPKIDPSKPISLAKLTESFQKMREQASASRSRGGGDSGASRQAVEDEMMVEDLVMGFGLDEGPTPVLGFGSAGELFAVRVTPADERTAKERMARYDRNRNGYLDKSEMSSNWMGNPMDFDRNGDGKLSPAELAVRYARRRVAEDEVREAQARSRQRTDANRGRERKEELEDPYLGRNSYRVAAAGESEGLPGWFSERDKNGDGQVMMAEYTSQWSDDVVREFFDFDINRDGSITSAECLAAVESGATRTAGSESSGGGGSSDTASSGSDRGRGSDKSTAETSSAKPSNANVAPVSADKLDPKYVGYAKRIIDRSDKNKDGVLTASEWKTMLLDISPSDANKDGRITIEEYAGWMQARSTK